MYNVSCEYLFQGFIYNQSMWSIYLHSMCEVWMPPKFLKFSGFGHTLGPWWRDSCVLVCLGWGVCICESIFLIFFRSCHQPLCKRPPKLGVLSKKRFGYFFRAPFFLGKWCGVATYFLYQKKKLSTNYMT